jgi:hypothetical protein
MKSCQVNNLSHHASLFGILCGINISDQMRLELIKTYCAGISFLDTQLGRILDKMDELKLWDDTTVVLTSDHGMHNGEKGIWEKWTLFEESTRVPLLISHPKSPFQGSHYKSPVELIDVYPTILDLVQAPFDRSQVCTAEDKCLSLEGKTLAGIVLGDDLLDSLDMKYSLQMDRPDRNSVEVAVSKRARRSSLDLDLKIDFSISQMWHCADFRRVYKSNTTSYNKRLSKRDSKTW